MTLTTCLALCHASDDTIHVAVLVNTRCICASGTAQFRVPQFRLKNVATGKYLTAETLDNVVKHQDLDESSDNQKWTFNGLAIESVGVPRSGLEVALDDLTVKLKAIDPANMAQAIHIKPNGQMFNQKNGLFVHGNGEDVKADFGGYGADKWQLGE